MNSAQLNDLIGQDKQRVDDYLSTVFGDYNQYESSVVEAMSYSLNAGGKRLRAIMLLRACQQLGGDLAVALPFGAAIELIHCYSLIHDDLPAMDDDELRRGKPTNHVVYGEAMAILAGDGLLNYAFELMIGQTLKMNLPANGLRAMQTLAEAAGFRGMLGGQVIDVTTENQPIDGDTLNYIHSHKTAALIAAALVAGAQLAGASEATVAQYCKFGNNLGMAFQIIDDILDVVGDDAKLGKPTGSDDVQQKNTYVKLYGLAESRQMAAQYTASAQEALKGLADEDQFFYQLSRALLERNY